MVFVLAQDSGIDEGCTTDRATQGPDNKSESKQKCLSFAVKESPYVTALK